MKLNITRSGGVVKGTLLVLAGGVPAAELEWALAAAAGMMATAGSKDTVKLGTEDISER